MVVSFFFIPGEKCQVAGGKVGGRGLEAVCCVAGWGLWLG